MRQKFHTNTSRATCVAIFAVKFNMPMNLHGFRGKIVKSIVARKNEETND